MNELSLRVADAEKKLRGIEIADAISKVENDLVTKQVYNSQFKVVPSDYYSKSLDDRSSILNANCADELCKTIVFENVHYKRTSGDQHILDDCFDVTNSRYYCVVVQYNAKIDTELVAKTIINLRKPGEMRLKMNNFNFQLAPEAVSDDLTGFVHNGVCPYAMKTPLPVIVCSRCLEHARLWMGGGHPDVKLCIGSADLIRSLNAIHQVVSHRR
jgi:prolyl-tRNA editing enzyme YbaK/EbsC (Cys-tRNA(Pro) deacylase)